MLIMNVDAMNIINAISCEDELTRMLPLIKDIALIEYDGNSIDGSCGIAEYMKANGIDTAAISCIILLGKKSSKKTSNEKALTKLFPNTRIIVINKQWYDVNPRTLKVWNTLVFHIGLSIGISNKMFDQEIGLAETFVEFVNKTRVAYYVCFLENQTFSSLFDNPYTCRVNLRLREFALDTDGKQNPPTTFCKDKQNYIKNCINSLQNQDAFFLCIEETEHGCETCNQCGHYGLRKKCPFAQRCVAWFYREGIFVPKDETIAHQWEIMASRQDYKPARIQVADDLKGGIGCKKNIEKALEIYSNYASQIGNDYCIDQILQITEEESEINKTIALPFIAQLALDGNEDMLIKLSDSFQNAEYGLPHDMVQQKEWILKGAENGNPRLVLSVAKMYEANSVWSEAYKWYKNLEEIAPELLEEKKLEQIELMMLTNGAKPHEVATKGRNYLYGYYGVERDLHLAFRCLLYASHQGIATAIGLLGVMYLEGLDVEKDFNSAINLFTDAASNGDLFSMNQLINLYHAQNNDYSDGQRWVNKIVDEIEAAISKEVPFAYYLKGLYQKKGYLYDGDNHASFENILHAAELDVPQAQFEISEMYASGLGTEINYEKAMFWLKKAAENGDYQAEGKYGIMLFETSTLAPKTKKESFPYLKNSYEKGYDQAYWCLAQCYMFGTGTNINMDLAYPLYIRAAEEGIIKAQELLCERYFRGDGPLSQNYGLCAKWGEAAIKQGSKVVRFETAYSQSEIGNNERAKELYLELANEGNAASMNNLGCLLTNHKEKAEWFLRAADKGENYGMWNIGRFYRDGKGVEQNIEKAIHYLTQSSIKGNIGAMLDLAKIYHSGISIEKNYHKAIEWYKKAADKDDMGAILSLAEIYSNGDDSIRNMETAIHYYKIAAEKDNSIALFKLGQVYEYGNCVEQNIDQAIYWYRKAANKGNNDAKESLKRLNSNWINEDGNIESLPN